ncbi:hypothetical protein ACFY19_15750 [Streptosporangium saharense]|uniref:hypothetical protein n=1 Tax=Streptosporangium saharense TaxID=1706840 RepID=UPI00369DD882
MSSSDTYEPYTYLTASVHEDAIRMEVAFCTAELSAMALTVQGVRPCLSFGSAEGQVVISTTGSGPVTSADLCLAREIADAATRYRDECERLHAAQNTARDIVPEPSPAQDNDQT